MYWVFFVLISIKCTHFKGNFLTFNFKSLKYVRFLKNFTYISLLLGVWMVTFFEFVCWILPLRKIVCWFLTLRKNVCWIFIFSFWNAEFLIYTGGIAILVHNPRQQQGTLANFHLEGVLLDLMVASQSSAKFSSWCFLLTNLTTIL